MGMSDDYEVAVEEGATVIRVGRALFGTRRRRRLGGAANTALIRLLADELDVARSAVRLVAGAAGRHKLVVVEGISAEEIATRWPGIKL
jgi:hypothetical protein